MIGHATSDERGRYSGGQAGDQTGKEVCVREWYSRPWNVVLWAKDPAVREKMALAMEKACVNNFIGYDQGTSGNSEDRYTLYNILRRVGFNMAAVDQPCETDCSQLVACCANCAGISISPYIYTGNEKSAFKNTGEFEIHTESKYLTSDAYIPRGAVLLYEGHHTAINLTDGSKWSNKVKNGWVRENNAWYYYNNGVMLKSEWILSNKCWYRVGLEGKMLTGWHKIYDKDGDLRNCYFEESGDYEGAMWHEAADKQGYLERWIVE